MRLAVVLAVLGAASPSGMTGQERWSPPDWVEASIQSQVAQAWEVDPSEVVLEWNAKPTGRSVTVDSVDGGANPELAGAGRHGEWIARLPATDGLFAVRVKAGLRRMLPVAARRIERGTLLTEADFAFQESIRWGPPAGRTPKPMPGWQAERRLNVGEELKTPAVRPAVAVRTGDRVKIIWKTGHIELTLSGVAIGSARPGETVGVRLDAGRRLRGVAGTDGAVRIEGV